LKELDMKRVKVLMIMALLLVMVALVVPAGAAYAAGPIYQVEPPASPDVNEALINFAMNFLLLVGPVLASLLAAYLAGKARKAWAEFKAEQPDAAYWLAWAAEAAVRAAEQAGMKQAIGSKKDYAIRAAQNWLALKGIKVDLALLEAAIEGAVWKELNQYDPEKNPVAGAELRSPRYIDMPPSP
jgi:hypothetical protein